jgi:hypothetical protein
VKSEMELRKEKAGEEHTHAWHGGDGHGSLLLEAIAAVSPARGRT